MSRPRAPPRVCAGTESATSAVMAGWPRPKDIMRMRLATTSMAASTRAAPSAASATAAAVPVVAMSWLRAAPRAMRAGPVTRGAMTPSAAQGRRSIPTPVPDQPLSVRTTGTATRIPNQADGRLAAVSRLRRAALSRTSDAGTTPCGRRRDRRTAAGAVTTSRTSPEMAVAPPSVAACKDSTAPIAAPPTSRAPTGSRVAPVWRRVGRSRQTSGIAASVASGIATTGRQPKGSTSRAPTTGPSALTVAPTPEYVAMARARPSPAKRAWIAARVRAGTAAAPRPCSVRVAMRAGRESTRAPAQAAVTMTEIPMSSGSRMPKRSPSRPKTALPTASARE